MELSLSSEDRDLIAASVSKGHFDTAEQMIHAALAALSLQSGEFAAGEWDNLLAEGEASIAAGGTLDGAEALAARRARRAQSRGSRS